MYPSNSFLLAELKRTEAARAEKQAEFLQAVANEIGYRRLCSLRDELRVATERDRQAMRRVVEGFRWNGVHGAA